MGLIRRFEDRLPQPFLPLSREQQVGDELPCFRLPAAEEAADGMLAWAADGVAVRRGILEDFYQ